MSLRIQFLFATLMVFFASLAFADDVPCSSKKAEGGYVCVCNSTYCDTVETPSPLAKGSYYLYSTSETSPGFTKTQGTFFNTTISNEEASTISSNVYVWVDASTQYQTYLGVGASITDSSARVIQGLPAAAQQKLMESFFGETGLEYTFVRVPIACSDFSSTVYSYDDVEGDEELKHFNLTEADYTLKIPMIKWAMQESKRGIKLIAVAWTAPSWMKTNNDSTPSYLQKQYHAAYANYHLKFLEAYRDNGINFWAISHGNEVIIALFFGSFFAMPNLVMLPADARHWVKYHFGPTIRQSDFKDIKILTLEDERPFLDWWVNRFFADEEVTQYIDGVALHWYFDSNGTIPQMEEFHKNNPDKFMLYTESSINAFQSQGGTIDLGDWTRALRYINDMFQNLGHWVVGYIDWNIALNQDGGPAGPTGMSLDASVIVNITTGEFYKQPLYYALGHFSKFLPPGSKRVHTTIKQDSSDTHNENTMESLRDQIKNHFSRMNVNKQPTTGDSPSVTEQPGDQTTADPFPTRKPDPPSTTVLVLASSNPDGSRSVIAYNPRSESANLIITDPEVGTLTQTVEAHSLNSFVYWTSSPTA